MLIIHVIFILILFLPFFNSSDDINIYNISLGTPLNITNLQYHKEYLFNIEAKYPKTLRIKIIVKNNWLQYTLSNSLYIKEYKYINNNYSDDFTPLSQSSAEGKEYEIDEPVRNLFSYTENNSETNFCTIKFVCEYEYNYFYIVIEYEKPYDLPVGITKNFYNILEFYTNHFFITGVKRFQRINVTMTAKSTNNNPFSDIYISEYINRTEEYHKYVLHKTPTITNYEIISQKEKIFSINFFYDIEISPTIVLSLKFLFDLDYLSFNIEVAGGEIFFNKNYDSKNITNLKANNPYYLFCKTVQFQTIDVTLSTKNNVKIYEYKNKSETVYKISEGKIMLNSRIDEDKLNIYFTYRISSANITDIGFQFIPKFDLDFVFAQMEIKGGSYYLNDEDVKRLYIIYPGYELYFWINSSQYETVIINIKTNYLEGNPFNNVDIYYFFL